MHWNLRVEIASVASIRIDAATGASNFYKKQNLNQLSPFLKNADTKLFGNCSFIVLENNIFSWQEFTEKFV